MPADEVSQTFYASNITTYRSKQTHSMLRVTPLHAHSLGMSRPGKGATTSETIAKVCVVMDHCVELRMQLN